MEQTKYHLIFTMPNDGSMNLRITLHGSTETIRLTPRSLDGFEKFMEELWFANKVARSLAPRERVWAMFPYEEN